MKWTNLFLTLLVSIGTLVVLLGSQGVLAENIDPYDDASQYPYGENIGWLYPKPLDDGGPGAEVEDNQLTGYIWAENIGWVSLSCENTGSYGTVGYGAINDGSSNLSGYDWGENVGWTSFSCENTDTCGTVDYGVAIDPATGEFNGHAWRENSGWITFRSTGEVPFGVTTSSPENATLFLQSVCGTPIIDGVLNDGEWDNAASVNFPVNIPGGGTVAGGMLVLNDAFNLYIALWANHVDLGNTAYISFDMNGIIDPPDDSILYNPTVGFVDEARMTDPPCPSDRICTLPDTEQGGTQDGEGAFSNAGGVTVYEFSHPLDSGDPFDFSLEPGDSIRFNVFIRYIRPPSEWPVDVGDTSFPALSDSNALNYGVIKTADCGKENPVNEQLGNVIKIINSLSDNVFKNRNMRNAFTNKINAVIEKVDQGFYQHALNKLEKDIIKKTDGFALNGSPDKNDWITNSDDQNVVYPLLLEAIDRLRVLIYER